jgi:hypothetical protein
MSDDHAADRQRLDHRRVRNAIQITRDLISHNKRTRFVGSLCAFVWCCHNVMSRCGLRRSSDATAAAVRALLVISKLLQTIANQVRVRSFVLCLFVVVCDLSTPLFGSR